MNGASPSENSPKALSVQERVDEVCKRFEVAYQAGQRPSIEHCMGETPEPQRSSLLRRLLGVELACRKSNGESATLEEYRRRFPNDGELVTAVYRESILSGSRSLQPNGVPEAALETRPYQPGVSPVQPSPVKKPPLDLIGKYRIVEKLGEGGQAEVFRAVHPVLRGRDVVIKLAKQRLPESLQQQLLLEGQALARLEDLGLAQVYDVDVCEGRPFLVMEYIVGRSLSDWLQERQPTPREAAALVAQLARTLAKVHGQGVLHRDLKPANILIDAAGQPRVLDFGLALMSQPWEERRPTDGGVCGTYAYMAPEQAEGRAERIGPRTDVFGLGAVLYEILTGRPPYQAPDANVVWEQARQGQVPRPRQLNPRVPPALERICLKTLATDPEQRYASAAELERALRGYLRRPYRLAAVAVGVVVLLAAVLARWLPDPAVNPGPVVLKEMTIYVRRGADHEVPDYRELVKNGRDLEAEPIRPPLSSKDDFQLTGAFERPMFWYLVWFDTRGEVTVAAQSDVRQAKVEYPSGEKMMSVNPDDPPGVHALVLMASRGARTEGAELLEKRFHGIGRPPTQLPQGRAVKLRGPGGERPAPSNLYPSKYLQAIKERMPPGLEFVYVLFLETKQ
jgi:tRNA A-37 threonylcarbamoyl transferase component Bud32